MNRPQVISSIARVTLMLVCLALASLAASAQNAQPQNNPPPSVAQAPPAPGADLAQMRTDLNRMESLLGNMSSEIEFLRDQNLQILLRTNAQMWTILIRDLRGRIDREEQQRSRVPQPESGPTTPKSAPR
jgi:hypothetical protein